ncbi:28_t:CDS:2, partial [Funneliformis mosseae]
MEDSPVNAAHAFANAAEELKEKEQWGQAMQAHFRAAEQFALAINYTSDPEAIRSLKIQYTDQTRQGKEVQRRLAKQAPPQEKSSPSSSNRTRRPSSSTSSKSSVNNPQVKNKSEQRNQQNQPTLSTQPAVNSGILQINSSSDDRLSSDFLKP